MARARTAITKTETPPTAKTPLPKGWAWVRFGDVVREVNIAERTPLAAGLTRFVGLEHLEPSDLRVRSWGNVADGVTFTRVFRAGQVLFGKRRAYQRKAAVPDFDGICSADILVFQAKPWPVGGVGMIPELLPYIVQTDGFFEKAVGTSAGSLSPRTKFKDLAKYEFTLPAEPAEQRRIAEVLVEIDRVVDRWSSVSDTYSELSWGLVEQFLSGSKTDPRSWPRMQCQQLFSLTPRNGISPPCNEQGVGYPTLSLSAVRDGKIIPENGLKYVELSEDQAITYRIFRGDLLIVRGNGNKGLVAKCGLVESVPEGCVYPDLLIRITFDPALLRPKLGWLQWNCPTVHQRLCRRAKSTNGIWKVNGDDLNRHELIVPPLKDQDRFLALWESIHLKRPMIEAQVERSKCVKKHLFSQFLTPFAEGR